MLLWEYRNAASSFGTGALPNGCRQAVPLFQLNQGWEWDKLKQHSHPASAGQLFGEGQSEKSFSKSKHWKKPQNPKRMIQCLVICKTWWSFLFPVALIFNCWQRAGNSLTQGNRKTILIWIVPTMTSIAIHEPNLLAEFPLWKLDLSDKCLRLFFPKALGRVFPLVNELRDNSWVALSTPTLSASRELLSNMLTLKTLEFLKLPAHRHSLSKTHSVKFVCKVSFSTTLVGSA